MAMQSVSISGFFLPRHLCHFSQLKNCSISGSLTIMLIYVRHDAPLLLFILKSPNSFLGWTTDQSKANPLHDKSSYVLWIRTVCRAKSNRLQQSVARLCDSFSKWQRGSNVHHLNHINSIHITSCMGLENRQERRNAGQNQTATARFTISI